MVSAKKHIVFPLLLMIIFGITGCQKAPINGDLDGRWQIMEIEVNDEILNVKDRQLYYNFYMHVCNLSYYGGVFTEGNSFFEDDILAIEFPYVITEEGLTLLENYGIYSNPVEFKVICLDKKKLVMQSDESLITLRKF